MDRISDCWILTFSGIAFNLLEPRVEDINLTDIAHSLSMQCRFVGHCRRFYSVAEHSVNVSRNVSRNSKAWGLLHDASEAYIADMSKPLKLYSRLGVTYQEIEERLMRAICERFDLPFTQPEEVTEADKRMLMTEKRDLLSESPIPWDNVGEPYPERIKCYTPTEAEMLFLRAADNLNLRVYQL